MSVLKHAFLMCVLLSLAACSQQQPVSTNAQEVEYETVLDVIEQEDPEKYIIDLRTPAEYQTGHIPGAVNIPHDALIADPGLLELYKDKGFIFYCQSGRRAGLALNALKPSEYKSLEHLSGDMKKWKDKNLPIVTGPNPYNAEG